MLSFLLLPLYTGILETARFGDVTLIFSWIAIFNVILTYGMETAFFRFYNSYDNKEKVVSTSLIAILVTSIAFMLVAFLFKGGIAKFTNIEFKYVGYVILILTLDALVVIPFAWLRANERATSYAAIKMLNIGINFGLSLFFLLLLPRIAAGNADPVFGWMYRPNFEISYIFIANVLASGVTLALMLQLYVKTKLILDAGLLKKMLRYALPVLVAGIAFTINEVFDKIMLDNLLPEAIAKSEVGKYGACYRLSMFMTLFGTAFRMGIEPFFFSHAGSANPQKAYADITNYFVVLGSIILLTVMVFADVLKILFVRNEALWEAMDVVPIIVLASFFLGIYHNLSVWYKVTDKTRFGAFISVIGALITIAVNYFFIPIIGYMASAIATLLAYGTMMVLSYYFGRSRYPVPYNFRKILFYLGVSIVFSIISFYAFDRNLIVGIVLLLIFLGLVYKLEGKQLIKIFSKK